MAKSKWLEVKAKLTSVETWAQEGLSEEKIAKKLGINVNTLYAQKRKYPELAKALERSKSKCKCLTCRFSHREEHDGLRYLICGQEACLMNCLTCDTPPCCGINKRAWEERSS